MVTTKTTRRAVLVGCGSMSTAWVKAVQLVPEVELMGLADLFPASAEKLAATHGLKNVVIGPISMMFWPARKPTCSSSAPFPRRTNRRLRLGPVRV